MSIEVTCPSCRKTMTAKDSAAGKRTNCPECGGMISIPEPVYDAIEDGAVPGHFDQGDETQSPTDDRQRSPCPLCGEMIISDAAKCRFCGEYVDSEIRGLWREGNLLVMRKEATLPDRCVKSNEPTTRSLKRNLTWHHPAIYFVVLVNLIIYAIVALIVQKRAKIAVGLSDKWFTRRRRAIIIGWTTAVLASILFCSGTVMLSGVRPDNGLGGLALAVATVLGLGGIIYGVVRSRIVTPARITDTHIWLKGVHPDYMAELPIWSEGRA